jgi:hypothetical protein
MQFVNINNSVSGRRIAEFSSHWRVDDPTMLQVLQVAIREIH